MLSIGDFIRFLYEKGFCITDNFLINFFIFLVLETITYAISYRTVGKIASKLGYDSKLMSFTRRIIELVLLIVTLVVVGLIMSFISLFV